MADLRPVEDQRGVLVVCGSGVVTLDLFDKASTLATYWNGLLSGYALDALAAEAPSFDRGDAEGFLERCWWRGSDGGRCLGLGRELHLGDETITGGALVWDDAVVHLAAFAAGPTR